MVSPRNDLDHRVAAKLRQRFLQQGDGAFEVKRVVATHIDMKLARQLWTERFPVPLEHEANVVLLPAFCDRWIDRPVCSVPEQPGLAVAAALTEYGLE